MNRYIKNLLLLLVNLSCLTQFALAENLPSALLINYEILQVNETATIEEIRNAYKEKFKDLNLSNIPNEDKARTLSKLESAFKKIITFHDRNPYFLNPRKFFYQQLSDNWIKNVEPDNLKEYYEATWRETLTKLQSVFKIPAPSFDDLDMSGGRGGRVHPKLAQSTNYYIGLSKIKLQAETVRKNIHSFEQVDLYREVLLLQAHASTALPEDLINKMLLLSSDKQRKFLRLSIVLLLENFKDATNQANSNYSFFANEFRKLLIIANGKNIDEVLKHTEFVTKNMKIHRNSFVIDPHTSYFYSYYKNKLKFLSTRSGNFLQKQAWTNLDNLSSSFRQANSDRFSIFYKSLFAELVSSISTEDDLEFVNSLAWKHVKLFKSIQADNLVDIKHEENKTIENLFESLKLKKEFLSKLDLITDETKAKVLKSNSTEFLQSTIEEFLLTDCNKKVGSLISPI